MRLLSLTIILLCSGSLSGLNAEESSITSVKKRSSEKLSRIRSLFAKLKAMRARDRGELAEVGSRVTTPDFSEKAEGVDSQRKDFDHFLFSDENEMETETKQPSLVQAQPKAQESEEVVVESLPEKVSVAKEASGDMSYVVQPGDALLLIARKIYRDPGMFKSIMKWNDLKSVNIFPNQVLTLKYVSQDRQEEVQKARKKSSQNLYPPQAFRYKVYKVGYGDSLARIASKFLGSQQKYMNLARLNDIDPNKYLFVGQKVIIPVAKQLASN